MSMLEWAGSGHRVLAYLKNDGEGNAVPRRLEGRGVARLRTVRQ
ncbi:hypothetical protein [Microbacterium ulmi]|nr:hypothetical protein [Microbacterium ulmi]NII69883.1 hypothetical protein [Microbacterium ulmi]